MRSDQAGPRDTAGIAVKFVSPTIANGMVYLGAQYEVDVYGLLPGAGGVSHTVAAPAGNDLTTLHDLVISQSVGDNGLVSLPGPKKNRPRHLSSI